MNDETKQQAGQENSNASDPLAAVVKSHDKNINKSEEKANTKEQKDTSVNEDIENDDPLLVKKSSKDSQREFVNAILKLERLHNNEKNTKGELKLTPRKVIGKLSIYDDFQRDDHTGRTRFEAEFQKLVKENRVVDVELTKQFLRMYGHKV